MIKLYHKTIKDICSAWMSRTSAECFPTDWRHEYLKNTIDLLLFYGKHFYGFSESEVAPWSGELRLMLKLTLASEVRRFATYILQDNEPRIKLQCTSNVFVGSKRPCPIRGIAPSRGRSRFQIFQADDIISKKQNNNRLDTIRYSKSEKLKVK